MTETTADPAAEPEADQIAALSRIASVLSDNYISPTATSRSPRPAEA